MKYLILILALLLAGCKTTKQLATTCSSATRSDSVLTARVDSTRIFRDTTTFATINSAAKDERVIVQITEYDTSKPVDYTTGKPPVLRRSYYKRQTNATQNAITTAATSHHDSTKVSKADSTAKSIATNDSAQTTHEVNRSGFPWSLIVIIACVVVAMVISVRKWILKH